MQNVVNRRWLLTSYPDGMPTSENWTMMARRRLAVIQVLPSMLGINARHFRLLTLWMEKIMSKTNETSNLTTLEDYRPLSDSELDAVTGGAFRAFANFGDIKGESTDKDHKDWITVLSYNSK